jgi:hypothetical protein
MDCASILVALPDLAEVGEIEAALAIEDEVVRALQ